MLTGEIKIHDAVIAEYQAVRGKLVPAPDDELSGDEWREYECAMFYRDQAGYPMKAEFTIKHRVGNGPLRLATRVITIGMERLRRADFPVGLE